MTQRMDSREGFTKGDQVKRAGDGPWELPPDGVVQGWLTYEHAPKNWYCSVTWGGRYIGRYQAHEVEHTTQPE
ncbi:hypothetical protein [Streptomyces europaeiscabiei]|uniref:hypothetical protein n=1 Tax=Streptomyces europaeiscabiei TaxID=146819 RepID=UPI0029AC2AB9|nr:hypothetical protein [Streptomyces europaeiscabiei]MDX3867261.1 hypothetical protein [Streptomyces europaeiscabiei]